MSDNEPLRRQLRFSVFLQSFGALMFGVACVVRASSTGFDIVTVLFGVVALLVAGAAVFTFRKMRALAP